MQLTGTWMTESGSLVYSVVPKCACTTIGQSLYFSEHGTFYDGDIHRLGEGLHKWENEASRAAIAAAVTGHTAYAFSCVRNPYSRILSAFFDKICSIQMGGGRYRESLAARVAQKYGIEYGGVDGREPFDQVRSFRRFLLYVRDTLMWRQAGWKPPLGPDIHWEPISGHLEGFVTSGGRYDRIVRTERFEEGLQAVFDAVGTPERVEVAKVPRFNESEGSGPRRDHPVEDYFDDLSMHLVREIYGRDFDLFGYDLEKPGDRTPRREVDLDYVHAMLSP